MTPQSLLEHQDHGRLWQHMPGQVGGPNLDAAYQQALAVRKLRMERGERPVGYKIGFTNRTIWERYSVFAPIWGTVWNTSLTHCQGHAEISLANTCQPRLEPEVVFCLKATPKANATLDDLFESIDWIAAGFEVVQSHLPDWKFTATDIVVDSGLHARLIVGTPIPVRQLADSATSLDKYLTEAQVELFKNEQLIEQGRGANVLDSPLRALHHFLNELRRCPGAPDLQAGDVITTGTWTDPGLIDPGETWTARFTFSPGVLSVTFN